MFLFLSIKDARQGDELDLLLTLVESYEIKHFPIAPPDPVDAINSGWNK